MLGIRWFEYTGCSNVKRDVCDVLNCSSDLDFELLVFWLSLVGSWVVEIYAWLNIWNFFDLKQPQQPQIKSVKIHKCFCSIFVWILINFSFDSDAIYDWEWQLTWYHQDLFGFTTIMQVFLHFWKMIFLSSSPFLFISVAKTYKKTAKGKLMFSANIEAYRLRIRRNCIKIWTQNDQKQLWILTLFIWGYLRSKKFQMVNQA